MSNYGEVETVYKHNVKMNCAALTTSGIGMVTGSALTSVAFYRDFESTGLLWVGTVILLGAVYHFSRKLSSSLEQLHQLPETWEEDLLATSNK